MWSVNRRSEQAVRTRQAVLNTARRLFFARGYTATSLQDIADDLGITKANVYYYFRTKDSLMAELLTERIRELETLVDEVSTTTDAAARSDRLIEGFVEQVVIAHRSLAPVDFTDPVVRGLPEVSARLDQLTGRAAALLFGAQPTLRQRASLAMALDLKPALRELTTLPDADMKDALRTLCRALVTAAS